MTEDITHFATFADCRCGEQFVTRYTVKDEGNQTDYDIAYEFDTSGNRTDISYGALTGFPTTMHESFEYNANGQVTAHDFPDNGDMGGYQRRDTMAYVSGYLASITADANGLVLKTSFAPDAVGRVTEVTPPAGHSGGVPQTTWKTLLVYNSNDELIRRQSAEPSGTLATRSQTDYIYDANGNVITTKVLNFDEAGDDYANAIVETAFTHDTLNRVTEVESEVDGSTTVASQTQYNRNGLPVKVLSPLAAANAEPANTELLSYDERDLLYRSVRGNGSPTPITTQFDYDANGNLTKSTAGMEETAGNRRITQYVYDAFDRLDTMTDPLGHVADYARDGTGRVTQAKVLQGGATNLSQVDYTFDLSGRNTVIARSLRDAAGAVISGTVNGVNTGDGVVTTTIEYTDASDPKTVDFEGNDTVYDYDGMLRVASVTDPKGNVAAYGYDANSNVTQVTSTEEDDTGGADQEFLTQFAYDQLDRLVSRGERYSTATGGQFNTVTFGYDSRGNLVRQTDARGHDSAFAYDGLSRRLTDTHELSVGGATVTTSTAYDANSRVVSRTDPNGNPTSYAYDPLDRPIRVAYADGTAAQMQYNRFGDMTGQTDPTGTTFTQTFDKLGRMMQRTTSPAAGFANPGTETFTYDALSRVITASDADSDVELVHDSLGNVLSESLTIGGGTERTVTNVYDDNGNRKKTIYPGGRTMTYTHDALERVSSIADGGGTIADYDYVGGRVARRTNGNGTQLDLTYDGIGSANPAGDYGFKRVVDTAHTVTSGGAVLDQRAYLWDRDHNKLQREDLRSGGPQLTHDYTYDGRSRLTGVDDGTTPVSFTYDAAGNRTNTGYALEGADAALNNYTQTPIDERGYDLLGNLGSFDARERWYTFDAQSRLTGYVVAGARTEDDFSSGIPGAYTIQSGTWSITDEVLSETTAATGRILRDFPTGTEELSFSYRSPHDAGDTADYDPERYGLAILRLLEPDSPAEWRYVAVVIEPTGIYLREWEDDVLVAEHDSASVTAEADTWYDVKVAYSGTNNTTITVFWAKRGQPFEEVLSATVTLAEDPAQELGFGVGQLGDYEFKDVFFRDTTADTSTTQVTYQYDALGRRVARTVDPDGTPARTEFYYDGPQIIEERNGAGSVQATYVYGNGVDEILSMNRASADYYYHQDDLYNVVAVTNGSGTVVERYDYGEFGAPQYFDGSGTSIGGTAIGNDYLFNGRQYDTDTGLYFYRSRYMDPQAGRFISRDTIGLWGDPANLGNGQAYVGNNPWSHMDPYGLERMGEHGYFYDMGLVTKGFFWEGPKGLVVGLWDTVVTLGSEIAHPIRTAQELWGGIGAVGEIVAAPDSPTRELVKQGGREWLRKLDQDGEAQGAAVFDLTTIFAPAGLAAKGTKATGAADVIAIHARVAANVAESKAAREASKIGILFEAEAAAARTPGIRQIGGRNPINSQYAGKIHPSGVRFTEEGFPDFSPFAKARVVIEGLTGNYAKDAAAANRAVGLQMTPRNHIWHHVEDGRTMLLVPEKVHREVRHTGGSAVIRQGDK